MKVTELVASFAEPVVKAHGCELWDVEYVREGSEYFLRIYLDKETGVDITDCEAISRALDPILDEADPIPDAYILEVSSPGIERDLKYDEHILACVDWDVEVRLFAPVNGSKQFRGVLEGLTEEGNVVVNINGESVEFGRDKVAKIMTVYDFGD